MASTQTTTLPPTNLFAPRPLSTTTAATTAAPTTTTKPATSTPVQPRRYKDFLTSALHQRFRHASGIIFIFCLLLSLTQRLNWLSLTGIRAGLLFLPSLAIFIIRVANLHTCAPVPASQAEALYSALTSWRTPHTLTWYVYSAWFFGELYLWSRTEGAGLGWVDRGTRYDERPLLNENPIFLRWVWVALAVGQTALHLGRGEDRVEIPVRGSAAGGKAEGQEDASGLAGVLQQLWARAPIIFARVLRLLVPGIALSLPLYLLFVRRLLWPYFDSVGRLFFANLPSHSRPTGLQHQPRLLWQTLTSAFALILLWELSNAVFTILVSRPPLRYYVPLTSETKDAHGKILNRSRDPNGSLLTGLKSKKDVVKSFAFWELYLICTRFETRRKTIYTEVDRADGSTWSQISKICLEEIGAVRTRIQNAQKAPTTSPDSHPTASPSHQPTNASENDKEKPMPKIATREVQQNAAVLASSSTSSHHLPSLAKSFGQNPTGAQRVHARARRALEWSADHVVSREEQQRLLSRQALEAKGSGVLVSLQRTPLGEMLQRTASRRVRRVVFGEVVGSDVVVHACLALGALCSASLKEDDFGVVARSVPEVVRVFTGVVREVEGFVAKEGGWAEGMGDVEVLRVVLKTALEKVLLDFGEYADVVGVTRKEMREAREAVGGG